MNKIPLVKLDLDLYCETLESGLTVYALKVPNKKQAHIALTTHFGSGIQDFVPNGKHKMVHVPLGVAHFLEHKMFAMEDGSEATLFFDERGADSNAFTSIHETSYYFSGVNNIMENLEFLLKFVSTPCITDESVEQEKGIIIEELNMYKDDPYQELYQKSLFNTFSYLPLRYPVVGTVKSVNEITRDDLMVCYNTFYHPSNMFLLAVGNIEPLEVIKACKNSKWNKENSGKLPEKIKLKDYKEPTKVEKEYEVIHMNINVPKMTINYKLYFGVFTSLERIKLRYYLNILFLSKFGPTSIFCEKTRDEKLANGPISYFTEIAGLYEMHSFEVTTIQYDAYLEEFTKEMQTLTISEEEFERKKKLILSRYIYASDSVGAMANLLNHQIIDFGEVIPDIYSQIRALNYYEMKELLKRLSFKNRSVIVMEKGE